MPLIAPFGHYCRTQFGVYHTVATIVYTPISKTLVLAVTPLPVPDH